MTKEIQELIAKNLPALSAGELTKYLEQAKKNEELLDLVSKRLEIVEKERDGLSKNLQEFKARENDLKSRENKVNDLQEQLKNKEFNLKIEELTYQLACEKSSKKDIFSLVETFVRNPRSLEVMTHSFNESQAPFPDPRGGMIYPTTRHTNEVKTTEILETK